MALFGVAYIDYQRRCARECRASEKPVDPSTELPDVIVTSAYEPDNFTFYPPNFNGTLYWDFLSHKYK